MVDESEKARAIEDARLYLGVPRPNADVLVALLSAWDMGYRRASSLAHVAGKILRGPVGSAGDRS